MGIYKSHVGERYANWSARKTHKHSQMLTGTSAFTWRSGSIEFRAASVPAVLVTIYSVRVHGNAIEAYYRRGFSFICKLSDRKTDRELASWPIRFQLLRHR